MQNKTTKRSVVAAVDPGDLVSGLVILIDGKIAFSKNALNEELLDLIKSYSHVGDKFRVAIEDVKPYSLKLTPEIINTCKFIGELQYRLRISRLTYRLISRSEVKNYIFKQFPDVVIPLVDEKIRKSGKLNVSGEARKASFNWVDDPIIIAAMRHLWQIPAEAFKKNRYGISKHSWQALAVGCCFHYAELEKLYLKSQAKIRKINSEI